MTTSKVYRRTGLVERFFIARQYLGFDSCVIVVAKYKNATSSNVRISKDELFAAFAQVIRKNPVLAVRVKDEKNAKISSFERVPKIDLNSIVTFVDENLEDEKNFRSYLERQLVNVIPNSGEHPLWRLSVSADNYLVYAWSHVIGDGQSGLSFHRLLLNALNNPDASGEKGDLEEGIITVLDEDAGEMLPPLENITDLSVSLKTLLESVAGLIIPLSFVNRKVWSGYKTASSVSPTEVPKAFLGGTVFLSPPEAAQLIALSRKHGATLTSVINIAGVSIVSKLLADRSKSKSKSKDQSSSKKFTKISTCIPVSLRPIAGVSNTAIGNIVSTFNGKERLHPLTTNPDGSVVFPWAAAAACSKKLRKSVPKTREYVGALKYLFNNYEGFYKGRLGAKRVGGLEVSNLGAFSVAATSDEKVADASSTDRWTIGRTCFTQSDVVLGPALKLSTCGDPEGGVNIVVSWGEGAVDNEFAEAFVQEFQTLFANLAKSDT
ncbi:hypothetical protein SCHPADRAFT_858704 [Schizopora paradoxa]|uniref:Alcohol acetyltransferase n=1 Tax=Schizopora paradoxa TaxID=27342 RepID=A0A0H2RVA1_9AGAM|nr:hypothetical protein SCHPADRAFT_858704 [Schizopora paradoxa]